MSYVTKFSNFDNWLDECVSIGFSIGEVKEAHQEYFFETPDNYKIAYWDREQNFGYVVFED